MHLLELFRVCVQKCKTFAGNCCELVMVELMILSCDNKNYCNRSNSPGPLTDDWKVTDDSSVNFHDVFFFIFCYNLVKNEEKHIMETYG